MSQRYKTLIYFSVQAHWRRLDASPRLWSPPLLKTYANQLDTTVDPKCPSRGEELQTEEHWLQRCPNAVALRQQLFGEPSPPLSILTTNPSLRALGAISQQQQQQQQQREQPKPHGSERSSGSSLIVDCQRLHLASKSPAPRARWHR